MKKGIFFITLILLLSLILSGCQKAAPTPAPAAQEPAASAPKYKVGVVVLVLTGSSFQVTLADTAKREGEKLGMEMMVGAPTTFGDYEEQVSIVEDMISKKVDLILLVAAHPQALIPAVEKAYAAGIPVINIDNKVESDKVVTYIGTDNTQGAYEAGKYIAEKIGGKGKIALLLGEVGTPNEVYRTTGFKKAIAEYPDIEIVVEQNAHWSEQGGLEVTETALQSNPDIVAIFGENDAAAIGAAKAVENAGKKLLIVGFDGTPEAIQAIKDKKIDATVAQFPGNMANIALRIGLSYLDYLKDVSSLIKAPIISPIIDTGIQIVDTSNVADFKGIWVSEMSK